ncbi:hypothetical protein DV736_g1356, partial [Chaetothyriales sp. CBS 134916]
MLSFLAKHPPRRHIAQLNRIDLDDGHSSVEFHAPTHHYLVTNRIPPAPAGHDLRTGPHRPNCALNPPMHWHSKQSETFHVLQGEAVFYLERNRRLAAVAGDTVHVPLATHHTFRNASPANDLLVEFTLDPRTSHRDEALFRNIWMYRDDCRRNGMDPNFFQVCMFNQQGNVCQALPGPRLVAQPLARLTTWLGSIIGKYLLGLSYSYEEWCYRNPQQS